MAPAAPTRVIFARDEPTRALALFPVDGQVQAHSWDLATGSVITSTSGGVRSPDISPDGQWLWWFDTSSDVLWRTPFGSSPRGRREPPLRLRPSPLARVSIGGDGTAVVLRPVPGVGQTLTLLPIGRVRPGAEPTLLGSFGSVRSFHRSRDDSLVAVDTGTGVHVLAAHTGRLLAEEATGPGESALGFAHDHSLVLDRSDAEGLSGLRTWDPSTHMRSDIALGDLPLGGGAALSYTGDGVYVETFIEPDRARLGLTWVPFDGSPPTPVGPDSGWVVPGSVTGGPRGAYASWADEGQLPRFALITENKARSALGATGLVQYPPEVGGISSP